jgi:DNA-binding NtrC family response regulator
VTVQICKPKLLAVDDEPQNLDLIKAALSEFNLEISIANDPVTGLSIFNETRPQIVLLDLMMPGMNGMEVLDRIMASDPGTDVVLMTAHYSTDSAVEAIHKGACDYLTKPLELDKFRARITSLLADAETRQRSLQLDRDLVNTYQFEGIIGRSPLMLDVFAKIRRVAPHFRTVLVSGATGTGKEQVARALQRLSPVKSAPFVVCNCSALVETLLESEFFGYVKGAFTGANQDKIGIFEIANGGTVFLDEIGELPLAAQAKLLRVVQNQEVQRVGSPTLRPVDVRIIAATNRHLRTMVKEEKFREDLFYRLAMVEITLPKLADRKEDLHLLERHFIEKISAQYGKRITGLTRRAQTRLAAYSWPGNVRELENVIGNACMMTEESVLDVKDLPEPLRSGEREAGFFDDELLPLEEIQKRHLLRVLERVEGNKVRAAEILGISRATVYQMLAKMKLDTAPEGAVQ